ncbi:DUF4920 domain-containing protein [Niabella drilacis]|uniref:DUF4920 domain-containing protein n=1 Tax=Niabella drilacis (strain DSM 25811 / CCM 8410 / CCUG 62505 / LMG 26954 / E90) TaxID=1285928 RepID=A0A1G7BPR2_NIADE|nr:DUF4920 domain-containing protein [Niabella drilacis]SDE29121.1 protein of unknown function [Niabella drilacis]
MRKVLLLILPLFAGILLYAQPPAGSARKGDAYGEKIIAKGALSLEELAGKLSSSKEDGVKARIKGTVLAVCAKKGCWLTMELPDNTKMQVKFKDYGFFVPTAIAGKTVVLEGVARQKLVSVNELKHYAEDAKKPQAEIDAITAPEKQVRFEASGVLVL